MNFDQVSNLMGLKNRETDIPRNAEKSQPVDISSYGKKKVILSWKAEARASRKDVGKKVTRAVIVVTAAVALILAILQEFFLILVIASLAFVSYVLSKVPPEEAFYELSTHGIKVNDDMFYYHELNQFYFTQNEGLDVLAVDVVNNTPPRLFITINESDRDQIKNVLTEHLNYLDSEPKTIFDRTYDNFVGKFNV